MWNKINLFPIATVFWYTQATTIQSRRDVYIYNSLYREKTGKNARWTKQNVNDVKCSIFSSTHAHKIPLESDNQQALKNTWKTGHSANSDDNFIVMASQLNYHFKSAHQTGHLFSPSSDSNVITNQLEPINAIQFDGNCFVTHYDDNGCVTNRC